jgi:hypothetical protein
MYSCCICKVCPPSIIAAVPILSTNSKSAVVCAFMTTGMILSSVLSPLIRHNVYPELDDASYVVIDLFRINVFLVKFSRLTTIDSVSE